MDRRRGARHDPRVGEVAERHERGGPLRPEVLAGRARRQEAHRARRRRSARARARAARAIGSRAARGGRGTGRHATRAGSPARPSPRRSSRARARAPCSRRPGSCSRSRTARTGRSSSRRGRPRTARTTTTTIPLQTAIAHTCCSNDVLDVRPRVRGGGDAHDVAIGTCTWSRRRDGAAPPWTLEAPDQS